MGRSDFDMDCIRSPRFTSPVLFSGAAGSKEPGPKGLDEKVDWPPGKRNERQVTPITANQLKEVMPRLREGKGKKAVKIKFSAETMVGPLNAAMVEAQVAMAGGPYCAFLAQIAHESYQLTAWDEMGSAAIANYEPVLKVDIDAFKQHIADTEKKIEDAKTTVIDALKKAAEEAKKPYKAPDAKTLLAEARKLVPAEDLTKMESYKTRLYHTKGQGSGLGNEELGDGKRFAGRGPIQLTGRDNYTRASKALGLGDKLAKNPELVADDVGIGMRTTVWFWTTHKGIEDAVKNLRGYVFPNDPKELVDKERMSFARVSRIINGSYRPGKSDKPANGEEDRWKYYKTMVETFWYTKDLGDYGGSMADPWGMGTGVMPV